MSAPNVGKAGACATVTKSDLAAANFASPTDFLWVGTPGSGTLSVVMANGVVQAFVAITAGYHPLRVLRVNSTGTGASDIVACWDGTA